LRNGQRPLVASARLTSFNNSLSFQPTHAADSAGRATRPRLKSGSSSSLRGVPRP